MQALRTLLEMRAYVERLVSLQVVHDNLELSLLILATGRLIQQIFDIFLVSTHLVRKIQVVVRKARLS